MIKIGVPMKRFLPFITFIILLIELPILTMFNPDTVFSTALEGVDSSNNAMKNFLGPAWFFLPTTTPTLANVKEKLRENFKMKFSIDPSQVRTAPDVLKSLCSVDREKIIYNQIYLNIVSYNEAEKKLEQALMELKAKKPKNIHTDTVKAIRNAYMAYQSAHNALLLLNKTLSNIFSADISIDVTIPHDQEIRWYINTSIAAEKELSTLPLL